MKNYKQSFRLFTAEGGIFICGDVSLLSKNGIVISAGESNPVGLLYEMAISRSELFE